MTPDRAARRLRRTRRGLGLLAGFALLCAMACDDLVDVDPRDLRIAVGAAALNVCPEPVTGSASVEVVASTFGSDGTLVEGVTVNFSPSRGTLSATSVQSDVRGEARTTLTGSSNTAFDPIVVTATDPEGHTDDVSIAWPSTPPLCAEIGFNTAGTGPFPACFVNGAAFLAQEGELFDIVVSSFGACNIVRASLTIDYNGAFVSFVEARSGGTFELDDMGGQTQPTTLSVMDDSASSIVTVEIAQDPPNPPGTNISSGPYVVLTFSADTATPIVDDVSQASPLLITEYEFADTDGAPYPTTDPFPASPAVIIVVPDPGP